MKINISKAFFEETTQLMDIMYSFLITNEPPYEGWRSNQ